MRKVLVLSLICSLPLIVGGCEPGQSGNHAGAQEQVGALPNYGFEADVMPAAEIGRIFERMGQEIQQNGTATFQGISYPIEGNAQIEFFVNRRPRGEQPLATNVGIEFSATGQTDPPEKPRGNAITVFQGRLEQGTPTELADALDRFAANLETGGAFSWDIHSVDFGGAAIIDQYLGQNTRNPRQPIRYLLDITFAEGEVQRHDDREDIQEAQERGAGILLGTASEEGVDQAGVVGALRNLSSALRAGELSVGEGGVALEFEEAQMFWGHSSVRGGSEKIEIGMNWPTLPPPPPPEEGPPPYHGEPYDMPVAEFAQLLQRMGAEILANGTFSIGDQVYTVGDTLGGEIRFSSRGMSLEFGWRR